uniref:Uncharacterized protein n=1 Tax=Rhizophora mucronata TaxID=61149 RepID=A0A2P2LUZ2_RHIMU
MLQVKIREANNNLAKLKKDMECEYCSIVKMS